MPAKPHSSEEDYFAREEALKKQKLALEQAKKLEREQKEELKKLHWMHCPKCGMDLQAVHYRGTEIDRCFNCNGIWIDETDLDTFASFEANQKGAVVKSILNIFKPAPKTVFKPAPKAAKKK